MVKDFLKSTDLNLDLSETDRAMHETSNILETALSETEALLLVSHVNLGKSCNLCETPFSLAVQWKS